MRICTLFILIFLLFLEQGIAQKVPKDLVVQQAVPTKLHSSDTVAFLKDTLPVSVRATATPEAKIIFIKEGGSKSSVFKDILPFITLLLGIGINKFLDWWKDKKNTIKVGERWVAELRGMDNPIQRQIDLLDKLQEENSKDTYDYPELAVISTLNFEIFKSLDKSELFKYIKRHKNNNDDEAISISNQTHGLISIFTHLHESLQEKFKEYLDGISAHTSTVNKNLQKLSQAFAWYQADLEKELDGDPIDDKRYRPILDLFTQYIVPYKEDGSYDLYVLQTKFFGPLATHLAQLRHDERTKEMADATAECFNAIKGLRMEKRYWQGNISTISKRYTEHKKGLKEVVEDIEERKK